MKKTAIFFIFLFLLFLNQGYSCICVEELKGLDAQVCSRYEWIFEGKVTEIDCDKESQIKVEIIRSFKGDQNTFELINVDCLTSCSANFQQGEVWLFTLNRNNALEAYFEYCEHSRKKVVDNQDVDYQVEARGTSYTQDLQFLADHFGDGNSKSDADVIELKERKYEKVDPKLIPWFLGISLVVMLLGYLIFNLVSKKKK